ncbi:hypothetical protein [Chengkuizengella axinellae]|uniref:Spore coat protein n=1 Tax=Chengkuizengella axinellae TaxID=3064388 RepID=A0ABT9J2D0_9BACL|nr:hypothetical protein [Chengkuizengella sp. 2205SS18-9]MDP5275766.1 hypothetical protein [Chengkuizengella sp. 2205SS18-9]
MGHFDETICDCCVCPMQCVLDQLRNTENPVVIFTTTLGNFDLTITEVNDFIVSGTGAGGGTVRNFPICNVSGVSNIPLSRQVKLKPNRTSVKGECSCCEDPTNQLLRTLSREQLFNLRFLVGTAIGFISDIGEGIVMIQSQDGTMKTAVSICSLNRIGPNL